MVIVPLHTYTRLCVGIDIAKSSHVAGFVSPELLQCHRRFDRCPTLSFANSRSGFEQLIVAMQCYGDLSRCVVLMERTGHYHLALQQFLQESGITVYEVHAARRLNREKTDKNDSLSLANALYSQVELGAQVPNASQRAQEARPPSSAAASARTLIRRRYELARCMVTLQNQLTAIYDEVFPEFRTIFKDPNGDTALVVRTHYPSPRDLAAADLDDIIACRQSTKAHRPGNAALATLQALASTSIGTRHPGRLAALLLEQRQLIAQLRQAQQHVAELDREIERCVTGSREGTILLSLPGIATIAAGEIMAAIGTIANFESAAKLRSYFGWAPVATQTGTSKNSSTLSRGGNRPIKKAMYLIAWRVTREDTEFHSLYERLVARRCPYDARLKRRVGKNKVMGRICGQLIGVMYTLLKQDYQLLQRIQPGEEIPEPVLYSREFHSRRMRP